MEIFKWRIWTLPALPQGSRFARSRLPPWDELAGHPIIWHGEAGQGPADLEIGDTAGLETRGTGASADCAWPGSGGRREWFLKFK